MKRVILLISASFLILGCTRKRVTPERPEEFPFPKPPRERLLDFDLPDLEGEYTRIGSLLGKVTVVNFWATWTTPCTTEVNYLKRLYKKYHPKGLEIIGVGIDYSYRLRDFVNSHKVPYPILVGNEEIIRLYAPEGIPYTLILDKDGRIVYKDTGFGPKMVKEFKACIDKLLSE